MKRGTVWHYFTLSKTRCFVYSENIWLTIDNLAMCSRLKFRISVAAQMQPLANSSCACASFKLVILVEASLENAAAASVSLKPAMSLVAAA